MKPRASSPENVSATFLALSFLVLSFLVLFCGANISRGASLEILPPAAATASQPVRPQPQSGLQSGAFATPLTVAAVDNAASVEWMDGAEHPLANPNLLRQMLWTQTTAPGTGFLQYGASRQPGIRHLRLAFTSPIAVGSVLVRGGDRLSVLRSTSPYPGNLADDAQWVPAQRMVNGQPSDAPVDRDSFALWVLPTGTKTRALRFTHTAVATDANFAGALGGVYVLTGRFLNMAPQAAVVTSENTSAAPLLIDEKYNGGHVWNNGPEFRHVVTAANPEWIILSWSHPVALSGLSALWAGFNAADAQIFSGPDNVNLQDAPANDWQPVGRPYSLHSQYPRPLGVDWMDFGKTIQTRAVRLRLTEVTDESHHPHLAGTTHDGKSVWLGELMALSPFPAGELHAPVATAQATRVVAPTAPIPVRFNLDSAGYVTLVIDDPKGNRVRNLVSNTWFEAGPNTIWWDGTDDLGRNRDAAIHGVYLIPTHFVSPGRYEVHGLYHKAIDLHYEFSVYNAGYPAWDTPDTKGGWLTNHTPPSSTLFVPAEKAPGGKPLVYLGSYVSEGGAGLAWVDLEGVKQGGRGWVGGNWTAAPYLARDTGSSANSDIYAYVGAAWHEDVTKNNKQQVGVVRLTGLTAHGDKSILNYQYDLGGKIDHDDFGKEIWITQMSGLAVHDNLAVVSLAKQGALLFADTANDKALGVAPIDSPRGVAFDEQGHLLVLSAKRLLRFSSTLDRTQLDTKQLPKPEPLVSEGLEDPAGLTLDREGNIYISDRGDSSQIKVFNSSGKFLRAIGHPGPPKAGPYDPLHMNNPRGLSIDSNNHLWVAEEDFQPKRISLWSLDGKLLKAFYGPCEYGGGGDLDSKDKNRYYYHGMEFKLDWNAGSDTITSVLYRPGKDEISLPRGGAPTTVLYSNGHRYFTNAYMGNTTVGSSIAMLYLDVGGTLHPVAALGKANDWNLFKGEAFKSILPRGVDLTSRTPDNSVEFAWSDKNNNGQVDPEEVTFLKSTTGSITIMPDLAMTDAYVDGKAMRYAPASVTSAGIPIYNIQQGQIIADGAQKALTDGGGQMLYSPQATVLTTAPLPFMQDGVGGIDAKGHRWSYPSLWPGLHPSHSTPVPDRPGELAGTTRLLGGFVTPQGSDAGQIWGINGNLGEVYLFTADGLFVTNLFRDARSGKPWSMPEAKRNMLLNDVSLHEEDFFPSLDQTSDGNIYVLDGMRTSIVRVDGLNTLHRIPAATLEVTRDELDKAQLNLKQGEVSRHDKAGDQSLEVTVSSGAAPQLKDLIADLKTASWATIDRRITQIGFNSKPDVTEAAITVAGGRLFAAFRTNDPKLLINSGAVANAPFKTGGALDLMIGTNAQADPKRDAPVEGDVRLLVYQVNGKIKAMLYRAVVPGTKASVAFSSPDRTITLDQVTDISNVVEFYGASGAEAGNYVFSIPLDTLGLKPTSGKKIKADIGILRGNGAQTSQRVYWSNKATGITSDVPSEAELTPNLWGGWTFKSVN